MKHKVLCLLAVLVGGSMNLAWADEQQVAIETDGLVALVQQREAAMTATAPLAASAAIPAVATSNAQAKKPSTAHYVVQLGAFTHIDQAQKWKELLAQEGIQVVLQQDTSEHGVVRVRSLPLATKIQAQDLVLQMKLHGVQQALIMFVSE